MLFGSVGFAASCSSSSGDLDRARRVQRPGALDSDPGSSGLLLVGVEVRRTQAGFSDLIPQALAIEHVDHRGVLRYAREIEGRMFVFDGLEPGVWVLQEFYAQPVGEEAWQEIEFPRRGAIFLSIEAGEARYLGVVELDVDAKGRSRMLHKESRARERADWERLALHFPKGPWSEAIAERSQ